MPSNRVGSVPVHAASTHARRKHAVAELLGELVVLFERMGLPQQVESVRTVLAKLAEERFNVAVVGQFKRGKSTLLNAIIGRELLPTGMLPVTSAVTSLQYGSSPELVIATAGSNLSFTAPSESLSEYVTERGNPGNRRNIVEVRVKIPEPYLRRGITFVDTPGIGSSIEANSRTTYGFVPMIDASLFVTSVDAPWSGAERELLQSIARRVPKIFFVLNKIDLAPTEERATIAAYVSSQIESCIGERPELYAVSAADALVGRVSNDAAALSRSGLNTLTGDLDAFLSLDRGEIVIRTTALSGIEAIERCRAEIEGRVDRRRLAELTDTLSRQLQSAAGKICDRELPGFLAAEDRRGEHELEDDVRAALADFTGDPWSSRPTVATIEQAFVDRLLHRESAMVERFIASTRKTLLGQLQSVLDDFRGEIEDVLGYALHEWPGAVIETAQAPEAGGRVASPRPDRDDKGGDRDHRGISLIDFLPTARARRPLTRRLMRRAAVLGESHHRRVTHTCLAALRAIADEVASRVQHLIVPGERDRQVDTAERDAVVPKLASIEQVLQRFAGESSDFSVTAADIDTVQHDAVVDAPRLSRKKEAVASSADAGGRARGSEPGQLTGCPICAAVADRLFDLFVQEQSALVRDPAERRRFAQLRGYCPAHTWQFARVLSPVSVSTGYAELLEAIAAEIVEERSAPDPGDTAVFAAGKSSDCEVCALVHEVESKEIPTLLEGLEDGNTRERYRRSFGLCLPHLSLAMRVNGDSDLGRFLAEGFAERASVTAEDMREYALRRAAFRAGLNTGEQNGAWLAALRLLAGDRDLWISTPVRDEL